MNAEQFVNQVVDVARRQGYRIETNREGLTQIDFGNKKLHARHLHAMFPMALEEGVAISALIEKVAPGRPCAVRPMREIIAEIKMLWPPSTKRTASCLNSSV